MNNVIGVRTKEGKVIGTIFYDVFTKTVIESRHKLKKLNAWAIEADQYDKLIRPTCKELRIIDKEHHKTYVSSTKNFNENKGEVEYFGRQYFLPLSKWQVIN